MISVDGIAIVTVQDGPSLAPGEIIAPAVGIDTADANYHNNYQDPEAFLRAGGRRGRQYVPLTDGTYFINRWFATVEVIPKTVVPIGYVGVVVSYYGKAGRDLSGDAFRHGERVAEGERGVWERPLGPGKYPFNTYAGNVILVPTTNFVLHWITGKSEAHRYDESLRSIDLVTKDAYEPMLPLSVVVHIDYQRAPSVIQRFGDVKKLITQTLDPMLSAYFRDVAHKKTMLELLHMRDAIQAESREELRRKFRDFDIECVDVLIGKPDTAEAGGKIETLLEQLRIRQLSIEQLETYERQRAAAEKLQTLNEAQAQTAMQTQLTNARVQAQIAEQQGEADLARARKQAEQTVVNAEAELARSRRQAEQVVVAADAELARSRRQAEQTVLTAEAESQQRVLAGRGEAQKVMQVGLSEASVLLRKVASFGDPRLYALSVVAEQLTHSSQPLVPERVFVAGGDGQAGGAGGMLSLLLSMMVAEKSGFQPMDAGELAGLKDFSERLGPRGGGVDAPGGRGPPAQGGRGRRGAVTPPGGYGDGTHHRRSFSGRDAGLPARARRHGPGPHLPGTPSAHLRTLRGVHHRPLPDLRDGASGGGARPRPFASGRPAPAAVVRRLRRRLPLDGDGRARRLRPAGAAGSHAPTAAAGDSSTAVATGRPAAVPR